MFQEIEKRAKLKVKQYNLIRKGIKKLEQDINILLVKCTFLLDEIHDLHRGSKTILSKVSTAG